MAQYPLWEGWVEAPQESPHIDASFLNFAVKDKKGNDRKWELGVFWFCFGFGVVLLAPGPTLSQEGPISPVAAIVCTGGSLLPLGAAWQTQALFTPVVSH